VVISYPAGRFIIEFPGRRFTAEAQRDVAAPEARNVSRKDAKAAKKIPLSSPFGKGGKRGILLKWRPADAVQDMLGARMILSISI
jgi:hypothetical protein